MKQKNMCIQILPIIVYIAIMLRFWIFLNQNYTWSTLKQWLLKELLSELKKYKVQIILLLDYKKRNDCKIFHSSGKLIASVETLMRHLNPRIKVLWQKIKNYTCKDWIALDVIIKHSVSIRRKNSIKKWR